MTKEFKDIPLDGKVYRITKFRAMAGRAIIAQYPISAILQHKEYERNEAVLLKLMAHVEVVQPDGTTQTLHTKDLIDNHVDNWFTLVKIEMEALKFNCPFLTDEFMGSIFQTMGEKVTGYLVDLFADAVTKMKELQ